MRCILLSVVFLINAMTALSQQADSLATVQEASLRRADSLMASYKFERALDVLYRCDSLRKDVLLRIGLCHFRLGTSRPAIRPYERILQMDSTNSTALNQLGILYVRAGDHHKAMSCFARLLQVDSINSYYCKQAGLISARLENSNAAIHWFKKALRYNPDDMEASVALGNLFFEMERYEAVDSVVQLALASDGQFRPILLLRAKSAFEQGQYATVVITVNDLLQKSDTTSLDARMLGVSYFHLQEYQKLADCMIFLLKNRHEQEWVYYYMGIASRELGDVRSSVKWFRLAAEKSISENTKTYYSEMGHSYEALGDYRSAISAYQAAYTYSRDGILLYHLARNYDIAYKDKTLAAKYYKKYLESDDTIRRAKEYARKRMQDLGHF